MIVVVDTTVLHRDVHAQRPLTSEIIERAEAGDWEVVVPDVVIHEAARQFPERLLKALEWRREAVQGLRETFAPLGLPLPEELVVDVEGEIGTYEASLRERFSSDGCSILETPPETEVIGEWAAKRRRPFKSDGTGAADAFVWLTVIHCARRDDVVFITANTQDFADPEGPSVLAPELRADLDDRGINPQRVRLVRNVQRFTEEFIEPPARALQLADALLANADSRSNLISHLSLAAHWFDELAGEPRDWDLPSGSEDLKFVAFDADALEVVSAEERNGDLLMALRAEGSATFDLFLEKSEAYHLPDDSPVSIFDWDWNDWFTLAQAEFRAVADVEVRVDADGLEVLFDDISPA